MYLAQVRNLTRNELENHLNEQVQFLMSSANSYDNGFYGEAKRIAVVVRTLLHDTNCSKSLLGQLEKKNLPFLSTAIDYDPESMIAHAGLIFLNLGGTEPRYVARLDKAKTKKHLQFDEWWNEIIFAADKNQCLTRKGLILTAANQDGGAHVDPCLNETYAKLSKNNSMDCFFGNQTGYVPVENPELTAIRQIAHELLKTIMPNYEKIPSASGNNVFVGGIKIFAEPDPITALKVGRNDLCPCGSGIKYKKCHGKN
jgi:hypothetical protein